MYRGRCRFFRLLVGRIVGQLAALGAAAAVLLFVRKFLHLFPEQSLEVVLGPGAEQTNAQVGVGKQSRERSTSLQGVLRSFLSHTHTSWHALNCGKIVAGWIFFCLLKTVQYYDENPECPD